MRIAVYCGANVGTRPAYEETAKDLGQWMAKNGHVLVFGGGGCRTHRFYEYGKHHDHEYYDKKAGIWYIAGCGYDK